jgi:UDP-N-acetyl-2-amino-2-deoxyglucuronate dehydrogenase
MAKQWRLAVIGTGVVGDWHVRVIPKLPNAQLVAVCDVDPARSKQVLEKNGLSGIPIYTDQQEMHRKEKVEVVNICTPSGNHLEPAEMAMAAGCNVISEKPLEVNLERIDRMIEAAKKNNVKLAGIFQNRWSEANLALKQAAEEGRFGKISYGGCYTPWYRTDEYYRDGGWRGTWRLDGGGAMMNQSVHAVDQLQWIVGPVKRVSAYASSRIHKEIEVEDTLVCSCTFENGAHGVIMGSTGMYPGLPVRLEVGGEKGTAVSENGLKVFRFRDERDADKELMERINTKRSGPAAGASTATDVPIDNHGKNIQHVLEAWEQGREAETCGSEARKAIAIILAMYESASKNGEPVDVK